MTILAENYGGRYPAGYGESANHERGRARAGVRGGILRRRRLFIHSRAEINEACALRARWVRLNAPHARGHAHRTIASVGNQSRSGLPHQDLCAGRNFTICDNCAETRTGIDQNLTRLRHSPSPRQLG